jgi:uncharacterized membrane protein
MTVSGGVTANAILLVIAFGFAMLMFTLFPVSMAVMSLPLNYAAFQLWKDRFSFLGYLAVIHLIVLALALFFGFLISHYGPEQYRMLLEWA